jgi:hypothetical protein
LKILSLNAVYCGAERNKDLQRILLVTSKAYSKGVAGSYSISLLVFHVYCDKKEIPDQQHIPVSHVLLSSFIATLAGSYYGKTIANYVYGIQAWHTIHGVPWNIPKVEFDALLKAAETLAPPSSQKTKHPPYSTDYISMIHTCLNPTDPFDVVVFACLTTMF